MSHSLLDRLINRKCYFIYRSGAWYINSSKMEELKNPRVLPLNLIKEILNNEELYKQIYQCLGVWNKEFRVRSTDNKYDYVFNKKIILKEIKRFSKKDEFNIYESEKVRCLIELESKEYYDKKVSSYVYKSKHTIGEIVDLLLIEDSFYFYKEVENRKLDIVALVSDLEKEPFNIGKYNAIYTSFNFSEKDKYRILKNYTLLKEKSKYLIKLFDDIDVADILELFGSKSNEELLHMKTFFGKSREEFADYLATIKLPKRISKSISYKIKDFVYFYQSDTKEYNDFEKHNKAIKSVELNEVFKKQIFDDVPKNYTNFQKFYFIYRRLCQKLEYDEEFYAGNQKQMYSIDHENISRINDITFENNKIVCWEFTIILAKICEELEIPYQILNKENKEDKKSYADAHTRLLLKVDGIIVLVDPTIGLGKSDLVNSKTGKELVGFRILNKAERMKDTATSQMIEPKEEVDSKKDYPKINVAKILNAVYSIDVYNITSEERLALFLNIIKSLKYSTFNTMEMLNYVKDRIFTKDHFNEIEFVVLGTNEPKDKTKEVGLVTVVSFNPSGVGNVNSNVYYLFEDNKLVGKINYNELTEKFINGELYYIDQYKVKLEGIKKRRK